MSNPDRPDSPAEVVVRYLIDHAQCSDCGGAYRVENVYILHQVALRIWDLAVVCHQCYSLQFVRAVVQRARSREEFARRHELTPTEDRRFRRLPPLAIDDVLDVTAFLSRFDGDFQRLFDPDRRDAHDTPEPSG